MKKITTKAGIFIAAGFFCLGAQAQDQPKKFGKTLEPLQCATPEYESILQQNNAGKHSKAQFEQWMEQKIAAKKLLKSGLGTQDQVVTLPVVVHVIHNGGPVGVEENISDEQILSQITVLNQDYRRMAGTNGFNTNDAGADVEIEFCLAQRDPNGLATNGIDRITMFNESPLGFDLAQAEEIKTQTQWDPEKYINIWTFKLITLQASFEVYGYSQFPIDSGLDGLVDPSMLTTANTDGILAEAKCFGSQEIYPEGYYMPGRNLGRTLSHEMGHFLGLRHIWGDTNNCSGTDYCADTPVALTAHQGPCPGDDEDSCTNSPGLDMWQNYMDYTNDTCLNIFTQDQKTRIRTVLDNSPRRMGLATSNSCTPGTVYDNDGSLYIQNLNLACTSSEATPEIVLHNSGTNAITTATISYNVDDETPATINWEGSLATGESAIVALPQITAAGGNHTLSYAIVTINGEADATPLNDAKTETFRISNFATQQVVVTIHTDNNPNQILWAILDENQDDVFVYNGGEYESNTTYTQTVDIDETGCYAFLIVDNGQNGICCANGEGYYEVKTADGQLIAEGGDFDYVEMSYFGVTSTLGTNNPIVAGKAIKLYPNPSNSIINIAVPQSTTLPESYTIYNNLGQVMDAGKINTNNQTFNIAGYANGVYFIKLNGGSESQTLQFIKY
ncbi:T9SS type A sorting domain-containing protein [Flavobacterium zepuense]|uniref:T9SS type A sorting domain-containing protein n=1 Tax=Flavobacterium zepuense TaxID=2593302 RepID=A0A552UTF4_9FLAO|nr:M43 family zinc metalloprotease [Flavobacterium zepuense]TRW21511.1 T9SS type A sorting domain-containing protein [Flavobacterium zepuense]